MKYKIKLDFDNTVCHHKFPEIGEIVHPEIETILKMFQDEGAEIHIYTMRYNFKNGTYEAAEAFLRENFPSINFFSQTEDKVEPKRVFGDNNTIYLDDVCEDAPKLDSGVFDWGKIKQIIK